MSFTSYKPFKKRNLFPKYMIVFLLGIFSVVLFTRAINIVTSIDNATQYIKQIIVTSDWTIGWSQAVVIDANATNNLVVSWGARFNSDIRVDWDILWEQATFSTWGFNNVLSENYCDKDWTTCKTIDDIWWTSYWNNGMTQGVIYYNSWNVGIWTDNPSQALEVSWNIAVSWTWTFNLLGVWTLWDIWKSNTAWLFGGRVWINTLSPQSALDVQWNLIVSWTWDIEILDANYWKFWSTIAIPSVSSITWASNTCTNLWWLKFEYFFEELCVCNWTSWIRASDPSLLCVPSAWGPISK